MIVVNTDKTMTLANGKATSCIYFFIEKDVSRFNDISPAIWLVNIVINRA